MIIPIYNNNNRAYLIEETLQSIKAKTYTYCQLVIVDYVSIYDTMENTKSLIKSASLSRFNMLSQLDFEFTEAHKQVCVKQFSFTEYLNLGELKALLKLNKKVVKASNNTYFNQKDFIALLNQFEAESLKQYFVGNKSFNPLMIVKYLSIFKTSNFKLSTQSFLKLMAKSILFYKSK